MRRLVTDNLLSLDGYSSGPDDEIDWFEFDEESLEWSRNLLRGAGSIVMGRRTYELFLQYWPTLRARKEEPTIAGYLTELPKLVFSSTLTTSNWENTRFITRPVAEMVREEKKSNGGNILFLGSASLLAALWKEHLVDELCLRIQPIVLGRGRPLFPAVEERQSLALKESRMFKSGVLALRYQVLPMSAPA
ncbi:MAG TPA: dihydrofolate reductase family protein [Rectinemataceae bacterium]|nr:dihydrofolate reductase family protein [Rectinemataceae bacterium]